MTEMLDTLVIIYLSTTTAMRTYAMKFSQFENEKYAEEAVFSDEKITWIIFGIIFLINVRNGWYIVLII